LSHPTSKLLRRILCWISVGGGGGGRGGVVLGGGVGGGGHAARREGRQAAGTGGDRGRQRRQVPQGVLSRCCRRSFPGPGGGLGPSPGGPGPSAGGGGATGSGAANPGKRVIENRHSNSDRSMTYLYDECSCGRAEEEEKIQRWSSAFSQHHPLPGLVDVVRLVN